MRHFLIFIFVLVYPLVVFSQDSINLTDVNGRKQGFWRKTDTNNRKIYEGHFKDGIPYGEFKYYYTEGQLKAVSFVYDHGRRSRTITYFRSGIKMAEGNFLDEKRDSLWRFFSEYDGKLVSAEFYREGKREGMSSTYYAGKGVAEIQHWRNGQKEGLWEQYYDDGRLKLKGNYKDDRKDGPVKAFYPSGQVLFSGQYIDGDRAGTWIYYTEKAIIEKKEFYENGKLTREEFPKSDNQ